MSERAENNLVMVDLAELGRGLETTFMGVAMVFGSLGKSDAEIKTALSGVAMPPVGATESAEPTEPAEKSVEAEAETPNDAVAETPKSPGPKQEGDIPATPGAAGSVSADDITKVIVAKIKQKRSNNAKIGALLKTYGVEKVSSLPEEKYEAFLTDISQL